MVRCAWPWLASTAVAAVIAAVVWHPSATLAAEAGRDLRPGTEPEPPVDANAIAALERMGQALMTLEQSGLTADITVEQVMDNGQKVQFGGTSTYAVRHPDRFKVQIVSDTASRDVYYDGKELVVSDPATGFDVDRHWHGGAAWAAAAGLAVGTAVGAAIGSTVYALRADVLPWS
jgi:hypothetical protein